LKKLKRRERLRKIHDNKHRALNHKGIDIAEAEKMYQEARERDDRAYKALPLRKKIYLHILRTINRFKKKKK